MSKVHSITPTAPMAKWRLQSLLLLCALLAELYFLLNDVPLRSARNWLPSDRSMPVIGELMTKENQVQIQTSGELVWEDAQPGQTLRRKQSILTLDSSKAEVAFLDGTGLLIDANSLVLLEKNSADDRGGYEKIVIRLLRGSIHKSLPRKTSEILRYSAEGGKRVTPEFEVLAGEKRIEVHAQDELSLSENAGRYELSVREGAPEIHLGSSSLVLHSGETVELPNSPENLEKLKPEMSKISLLTPTEGESISNAIPVFRWKNGESDSLRISIGSDPNFKSTLITKNLAKGTAEWLWPEIPFPMRGQAPQLFYWQVESLNNPALKSVGNFWLLPQVIPEILSPQKSQNRILMGEKFQIVWTPLEKALSYEVDFENGEKETVTLETLDIVPATEKIRFRVRAKFQDGSYSAWSEERALRAVSEKAPPPPPKPKAKPEKGPLPPSQLFDPELEINSPAPTHSGLFRWLANFFEPSAQAEEADYVYRFRLNWDEVVGIGKYRVQVAKERNFKNVITEVETDRPQFIWTYHRGVENSKGRVFYRVASVSDSGKVGKFSAPKPILISEKISGRKRSLESERLARAVSPPTSVETPLDPPDAPVVRTESPAPVAETNRSSTQVQIVEIPTTTHWTFEAAVDLGLGSINQNSSDTNLNSVSLSAPFLQQRVSLASDFIRAQDESGSHWRAGFEIGFNAFHKDSSTSHSGLQNDVSAAFYQLTLSHWTQKTIADLVAWTVAPGLVVQRSFRFVKSGPQSVDAQGALSVGPSITFSRKYFEDSALQHLGIEFLLPLSGALTDGAMGVDARVFAEWRVARFRNSNGGGNSLGFLTQAEMEYSRWQTPQGTQTLSWSFWVAPVFHLGEAGL